MDREGASRTPASLWSCVLPKPSSFLPLDLQGTSTDIPVLIYFKISQAWHEAFLLCGRKDMMEQPMLPPPLHSTSAHGQAIPPIKTQGTQQGCKPGGSSSTSKRRDGKHPQ